MLYRARDLFYIDQSSAVLHTREPLDRERSATYLLTVEARDGGAPFLSDTAVVMVMVEDVNDNAPFFPVGMYWASVPEGIQEAFVVHVQVRCMIESVY